ncbi:hypothetical protein JMJ77_0003101 [Colletotrichum scovillei]|uniref:Uncharacterized protein n=1 Tax=Colletotrichum scovillei TaxID=1209932 RepID=A0A9P7QWD5_9PEZI|nr:hypothetical protein JMJ78_0006311 [Colletotrichum scovillei]KAG7043395.1 hypothetical protein JMJ77_0003101 [Colletotrichum scovillei]KAG7062846.1 hypothetical protein JMJ76_0009689 [Colletotrichum scovillei]
MISFPSRQLCKVLTLFRPRWTWYYIRPCDTAYLYIPLHLVSGMQLQGTGYEMNTRNATTSAQF